MFPDSRSDHDPFWVDRLAATAVTCPSAHRSKESILGKRPRIICRLLCREPTSPSPKRVTTRWIFRSATTESGLFIASITRFGAHIRQGRSGAHLDQPVCSGVIYSSMPSPSQYGRTLFLNSLDDGSSATTVERVQFQKLAGAAGHDEQWLQRLIMKHPSLLPVDQIEAAFTSVVPVCLELPVGSGSGFLDNLLVTPAGDLVLVECKLWRNPQARREVVGQIIEYASEMSTWNYQRLEEGIRRATPVDGAKGVRRTLYDLVSPNGEVDEPTFCDAVSRNLRRGRFLLLIVGDGIREGVESMTEFLQRHGGLHFTLGLVELAVFRLPDGGFVVQPRVPAKTVNIERGVVTFDESTPTVKSLSTKPTAAASSGTRTTISQEKYMELLEEQRPGVLPHLLAFTKELPVLNVAPEFGTNAMILRWRPSDGNSWNLGTILSNGQTWLENMGQQANSRGVMDQHKRYLTALAEIAGAVVKITPKDSGWYLARDEESKVAITVDLLVADQARRDKWLDAIQEFQKSVIARSEDE
jgi:hypothetical protein